MNDSSETTGFPSRCGFGHDPASTWHPPAFEPGWVWLVGAGPGDPGLTTLLAYHALSQADVVVYDALVNPEILGLVAPGAERIAAGKRGGKPSANQADISNRLVHLARRNLRVLRLKGGDPMVFGRGAEEATTLVEAGIPFRIVPGITAGLAAATYAGIPATTRRTNAAITFLTGHAATGELPEGFDWNALATGSPVLVIYMGLKHIETIIDRLLEAGRDPGEPVAAISSATLNDQQVRIATLSTIGEVLQARPVPAPVIFILGEVVRFREALDWWGTLVGSPLCTDSLEPVS